jgi:hypothetical protein
MEGTMTRMISALALASALLVGVMAPASAQDVEVRLEIYGVIETSTGRSELFLVQYGQLPVMRELTREQQILVYAVDNLIKGVGQIYYRTSNGWSRIFYRVPDTRELNRAFMTNGVEALIVRESVELPVVLARIGSLADTIESFVVMPNGSMRIYPFAQDSDNASIALVLMEALVNAK